MSFAPPTIRQPKVGVLRSRKVERTSFLPRMAAQAAGCRVPYPPRLLVSSGRVEPDIARPGASCLYREHESSPTEPVTVVLKHNPSTNEGIGPARVLYGSCLLK